VISVVVFLFIYIFKKLYIFFSFYLFSFVFCKIREQEGRTGPSQVGGLAPMGGERWRGKGLGE
jgi:uncharacterized membrane protein YesL